MPWLQFCESAKYMYLAQEMDFGGQVSFNSFHVDKGFRVGKHLPHVPGNFQGWPEKNQGI